MIFVILIASDKYRSVKIGRTLKGLTVDKSWVCFRAEISLNGLERTNPSDLHFD